MDYIASISILLIVGSIIFTGLLQHRNVFSLFIVGAMEGIKTTIKIAPSIIGLVMMVTILQESKLLEFICGILQPICNQINFPSDVIPLALIRPISGSGALAVLNNILSNNGADTFTGRVASVMMGSTETTFYTIAMYFGSVNITKTGCTIPCALLADLTGIIMSVITVLIFFGV